LNGSRRDVYLGVYNSPESRAEYARLIAEMATSAAPTVAPTPAAARGLTVNELIVAFMRWAATHYRHPDGRPTSELGELKWSLGPLRRLYGHTLAAEFGPRGLAAVRQEMVNAGWCRTLVNQRTHKVKRVFRWAAAEELVPVAVFTALRTLAGLKRGRCDVRESTPVGPVDPAHVAAALPHVSRYVRAMVELQRLTGMRPGEVCAMTFAQIDRTGDVWLYRPTSHKTAYRGRTRVVPLGPRARAVLVSFLVNDKPPPDGWAGVDLVNDRTGRLAAADAYQEAGRDWDARLLRDAARPVVLIAGCIVDPAAPVFSPLREQAERYARLRAHRVSKVQPSQQSRKKSKPKRQPGEWYTPHALAQAVATACVKAEVPRWGPNRLRHLFATEVRKAHGLEAAGAVLGHAKMSATEVYAERDTALAVRVANEVG
jgi:integrase